MADKNFQNDFFDGRFFEKKDKKPGLLGTYSKQRFLPQIRMPIEYIVIIVIGVFVLAIISYAVGVERGKRISSPESVLKTALDLVEVQKRIDAAKAKEAEELKEATKKLEIEILEKRESLDKKKADEYTGAEYIIKLASFKKEAEANKEVKKLKRKNIDAHAVKRGRWHQVHAAGYKTLKEARSAQEKLAGSYKDCYIKQIR